MYRGAESTITWSARNVPDLLSKNEHFLRYTSGASNGRTGGVVWGGTRELWLSGFFVTNDKVQATSIAPPCIDCSHQVYGLVYFDTNLSQNRYSFLPAIVAVCAAAAVLLNGKVASYSAWRLQSTNQNRPSLRVLFRFRRV